MNAIPAVSQPPANTYPAQAGGPAQSVGIEPGAKATHFAAALQNADSKPPRKPAATKGPDGASTGGHSPPPGNPSPPAALPVVLAAPSLAGTIGGGAARGSGTDLGRRCCKPTPCAGRKRSSVEDCCGGGGHAAGDAKTQWHSRSAPDSARRRRCCRD